VVQCVYSDRELRRVWTPRSHYRIQMCMDARLDLFLMKGWQMPNTNEIELMDAVHDPVVQQTEVLPPVTPMERIERNREMISLLAPQVQKAHLVSMQGKSYMCVAGGIAVANALGYAISVGDVEYEKTEGKYKAQATMTDVNTGAAVATAWGYVFEDESRWMKGPKFALYSMTQTRAEAKLCRANFGNIYTLLGASSDTPAEEMMGVEQSSAPAAAPVQQQSSSVEGVKAPRKPQPAEGVLEKTIMVSNVEHKQGSTNGSDWQLWLVVSTDGDNYGTFDEKVASAARTMAQSEEHDGVRIKYTQTTNAKGYEQLRITEWDCIPF